MNAFCCIRMRRGSRRKKIQISFRGNTTERLLPDGKINLHLSPSDNAVRLLTTCRVRHLQSRAAAPLMIMYYLGTWSKKIWLLMNQLGKYQILNMHRNALPQFRIVLIRRWTSALLSTLMTKRLCNLCSLLVVSANFIFSSTDGRFLSPSSFVRWMIRMKNWN